MEEDRGSFKILTFKPTGKRPLGRPRCRWKDNNRMNLKALDISTKNWINLAQDRGYFVCGIGPPRLISHGVNYVCLYSEDFIQLTEGHFQSQLVKAFTRS